MHTAPGVALGRGARWSAAARRLLEGAAVVGDPFDLDLAAAAAAEPARTALDTLDELLALDVVRPTDAPRRFRFRHPLVRLAVYAATPRGWRIGAHGRAAAALADRGEAAVERAHHVANWATRGDRAALTLLREAAESSAQRAPGTAARWYRAALDLLPEAPARADERLELLVPLARVLAGTGQFADARAALLEAIELAPPARRVELTAACARVEHRLGRHQDAHARLIEAFESLGADDTADAVAVMLDLADDAFYRADSEAMRMWSLRALAAAERLGDAALGGAACAGAALAEAFLGLVADAQAHRQRAAEIVDALPDAELARRLDAAAHLVAAEVYLDRYANALAHCDRGLDVGRASRQGELFPQLTQTRGVALVLLGRLREAADAFDGAIEAARLGGNTQALAWTLFNRSWTALQAGDVDGALRVGEESVEAARLIDDSVLSPFVSGLLGAAMLEAGEPQQAVEMLFGGGGGPELPRVPGVWKANFHELATRAWLALRRRDEADASAARAEAAAAALGLRAAVVAARRATAAVLLAGGDAAGAAEAALESAAAADDLGAPIEAARSRTLAGRALAAAGDHVRAAAELERAAAVLHECGAVRYRDEAERELRRLGRRFTRPRNGAPGTGAVGSLTRRELEIAERVRDRQTNRAIATALFLSEKTVETHLRHIFGKLGVSSRSSVARALDAAAAKREG